MPVEPLVLPPDVEPPLDDAEAHRDGREAEDGRTHQNDPSSPMNDPRVTTFAVAAVVDFDGELKTQRVTALAAPRTKTTRPTLAIVCWVLPVEMSSS